MLQGERDTALDNLKGFLIISVVFVHLYDMLGQGTPLLYTIRMVTLAVQMPLFVFLSGYFGKHVEKRRKAALSDYLIPFLLFNTLYYWMRMGQSDVKYGLLRPLNMYWYLLTLLIIRLLMPELLRIKHILPVAVVFALLAGGDNSFGRTLSLSRTACFLPFYLMGYYCTAEQMGRIRRMPKLTAIIGGGAGAFLTLFLTDTLKIAEGASHPFQLVSSYETQGLQPWEGILFRAGIYIAAPLLGIMLLRLIPNRHSLLTHIGRGSMTVYLLHAFPMLFLVGYWHDIMQGIYSIFPVMKDMPYLGRIGYGIPQMVLLGLYAFVVSWALSSTPIVRLYDRFMDEVRYSVFHSRESA